MKKIIAFILIILLLVGLTSCSAWATEYNSLEEYIEYAQRGEGFSQYYVDYPEYFLPSNTFITDYDYSDGGFYCFECGTFDNGEKPAKSILWLQYTPEVYAEAKASLNGILDHGKDGYYYGNYSFFMKYNVYEKFDSYDGYPAWFTMAGYNDTICTLFFLGFSCASSIEPEEVNALMEPDFGKFLNTFYSEQYNFEENCPVD